MCVIIASPNKKYRPTPEILHDCARANPDGSGLAWVQAGEVHYLKGMKAQSIAEALESIEGPVVIHFRIATVGGKKPELCHPFPIEEKPAAKSYGQARCVLFHNGTWDRWQHFIDEHGLDLSRGPISDSRVAAAAAHVHGFHWLAHIPNRFALLSARRGIKILGDWRQIDGIWYSNDYWLARARRELAFTFFK